MGNHNHTFAKRWGWAAYHDESLPFLSCVIICKTRQLQWLKNPFYTPDLETPICDICADLDYGSALLKVDAWQLANSSFEYPKSIVSGSPMPPACRPIIDDPVMLMPVQLTFFIKRNMQSGILEL